MRFAPGSEMGFADEAAEMDSGAPEPLADFESSGPGWKGVLLPLLMVPVLGFAIVALNAPAILTAKFWRAGAENAAVKPAAAPAVATNAPSPASPAQSAPPQPRRFRPTLDMAPAPDLTANSAAPPQKTANSPDAVSNAAPDEKTAAQQNPKPAARLASRQKPDHRGASGFYAQVIQPDGSLEYRHFSANPVR